MKARHAYGNLHVKLHRIKNKLLESQKALRSLTTIAAERLVVYGDRDGHLNE